MLATPPVGDNATAADGALRERLEDVRALMAMRRVASAASALIAIAGFLRLLPLGPGAVWMTALVAITFGVGYPLVLRARSVAAVDRALTAFGFVQATMLIGLLHFSADIFWVAMVLLALNVVGAATTLSGRRVAGLTVYSSVMVALYAGLALGDIVQPVPAFSGVVLGLSPLALAESSGRAGIVIVPVVVITGLGLPGLAAVTFIASSRARSARDHLAHAMGALVAAHQEAEASRDQIRALNDDLNNEAQRKTAALEEQNRYLAGLNAVSFALRGDIDDESACERVAQLVVRVLEVEVARVLVPAANGEPALLRSVPASWDSRRSMTIAESAMERVAGTGAPEFAGPLGSATASQPVSAVVPIVAGGEPVGALAVAGQRSRPWSEQDRDLLTLAGRELGSALAASRHYRTAVLHSQHEATLSEVMREVSGDRDLRASLRHGLARAASRLGVTFIGLDVALADDGAGDRRKRLQLVSPGDGARPTDAEAAARDLVAGASSLVRDRWHPLVLGPAGEAPVSSAARALGVETLIVAPIMGSRADEADDAQPTSQLRVVGALVAAGPTGSGWTATHVRLLARLAEVVARRVETDDLARVQSRRIQELSGLAHVAAVVQSTVDHARLFAGFAQAMHRLAGYERLHLVWTEDVGDPPRLFSFQPQGRPEPAESDGSALGGHPWLNLSVPMAWRRSSAGAPDFVDEAAQHGIVVPMRPRGLPLGFALIVTSRAPSDELVAIAGQAVEQLGLALDSATLYRQATDRAARIQVLSHLARIVASTVDLREAFGAFADEVRWLIPFDRAVLMLVEPGAGIRTYATYPDLGTEPGDAQVEGAIVRQALGAGGPAAFRGSDEQYSERDWSPFGSDLEVVATVPVLSDGGAALFALGRAGAQDFTEEEFAALSEVASLLAVTIDRVRMYDEAEYEARHDSLTGLPNRRSLDERLEELAPALAEGERAALLMIDLDGLKVFNDTLGHAAGDRLIQIVARELRECCRADDMVARVGGDEFVVLMTGGTVERASDIADRIHRALSQAHDEVPGAPTRIHVSIGVATAPADGTDASTLLTAADEAMYEAKFAGGRRTRVARPLAGSTRGLPLIRQPNRVVARFVDAMFEPASRADLDLAARAERLVVAAAVSGGVVPDAVAPLRMLLLCMLGREAGFDPSSLDAPALDLLLEGLREEWSDRAPDHAEFGLLLCEAAIALVARGEAALDGAGVERALQQLRDGRPEWGVALDALEAVLLERPTDGQDGSRAA